MVRFELKFKQDLKLAPEDTLELIPPLETLVQLEMRR